MIDHSKGQAFSGSHVVAMVAGREISTRLRSRTFIVSNAVILALIAGGLILTAVLQGHFGKPPRVGLIGPASVLSGPLSGASKALATAVTVREVPTEALARKMLADGDLKIAIVQHGSGYLAMTQKSITPQVLGVLTTAVRQRALSQALIARQIDPVALAGDIGRISLSVDAVHPPKKDADQRTAFAFGVVSLLYLQLLGNGVAVASGVVEEKTSRVVELLLATIKPVQLLVGKICGIGAVGLAQLAAYGAVGLGVGRATGLVNLNLTAVTVFAGALGWFVLGFLFLGVLYAAAGSLVSRQEEVSGATGPLTILVISMFGVAQASVRNPDGTLASVMSWIPPFSAILMPLRIAAGVATSAQILGTVALMLITSSALAMLSARIYERSILHIGSRISWTQAFGRGRSRTPIQATN